MSGSGGDLINNKDVPLDNNIIADILGKFMQWNPWGNAFTLAEFRLEALYARACGFRLGPRVVTADVLESLGSLFALAMFHAMISSTSKTCPRYISLLQMVMSECLIVMDKSAPLTLMHPGNKVLYWKNILSGKYFMVDVLDETIELSKAIVRDVSRQVRTGRERGVGSDQIKGKKRNYAADCMQPHSVYFLCMFGITHISLVSLSECTLQYFPGLVESALISLVCNRVISNESSVKSTPDDTLVNHMISKTKETDKSLKILDLTSKLGFIVVKCLDAGILRQVNLVKGRLNRKIVHPTAAFARTKALYFQQMLQSPIYSLHPHLLVQKMDQKKLYDLKLNSASILASVVFEAGRAIPSDYLLGLSHADPPPGSVVRKGVNSTDTGSNEPKAENSKDSGHGDVSMSKLGEDKVRKVISVPTSDQQEYSDYWALHPRVRAAFSVTRPLRMHVWELSQAHDYLFRSAFTRTGQVTMSLNESNSSNVSAELDRIESVLVDLNDDEEYSKYLATETKNKKMLQRERDIERKRRLDGDNGCSNSDKPKRISKTSETSLNEKKNRLNLESLLHKPEYQRIQLPRFLDPAEGMYWVCIFTSEYLEQELSAGRLFGADDWAALDPLLSGSTLRTELAGMRRQRLNPEPTNSIFRPPSPQINALVSSRGDVKLTPPSNSLARRATTTEEFQDQPKSSSGTRRPMTDLQFKLQLAKKEANLELRVGSKATAKARYDPVAVATVSSTVSPFAHPGITATTLRKNTDPIVQPSSPILREALLKPVSYSTTTGQTKSAIMSESEWKMINFLGDTLQLSVVWCQLRMKEEDDKLEAELAAAKKAKLARARRLDPQAYVKEMRVYKESVQKQEETHKLMLEDISDNVTGMLRTYKAVQVKELKESRKRDNADSMTIKNNLIKAAKEAKIAAAAEKRRQEEIRIIEEEKEIFRIRAIKNRQRAIDTKEEENRLEREKKERERIKMMADKAEYDEILRRIQEEDRMKFLEEQQRGRERRKAQALIKKQDEQFKKQAAMKLAKQKAVKLTRRGNFMWHNGAFGFYKDARAADIPYIEYADDYGTPYYYDPLKDSTTYDKPGDAPIIHHTDKEREEFDAEHGEGEYDKLMEQRRFKDQCNIDGGYYSKTGVWLPLNGYYDENYNFVPNNS